MHNAREKQSAILTILRIIEGVSEWSGRVTSFFLLALTGVICFEVFRRFVLNHPSIYTFELASMLGVVISMGALAYTYLHEGHIRVDVFWSRLPPKGRVLADVVGSLLFFFPLIFVLTYLSGDWLLYSIRMHEVGSKTHWYPIFWPVRAVMLLGLCLFILQGVAKFIRDIQFLKRKE
jgi:TRAP-type mannitol/chloroaromatic compound transport system permease small subunit